MESSWSRWIVEALASVRTLIFRSQPVPQRNSNENYNREEKGALPVYTLKQLETHSSKYSCWLVISGKVYDVTSFLARHPGGAMIILKYAGRDATSPFFHRGHSLTAIEMLDEFLIGTCEDAKDGQMVVSRKHAAWRLSGGSIEQADSSVGLWEIRRGFLPTRDPRRFLDKKSSKLLELEDLVSELPIAIAEGSTRELLKSRKEAIQRTTDAIGEMSEDELNRAHSLLSYLGVAYVRTQEYPGQPPLQKLPRFLSRGWVMVSRKLGRHPMLDYADCVLYNWERLDQKATMTMGNIRLLNRFTGVVDEEHFFKTHVIIESEATPVIEALLEGFGCVERKDVPALLRNLKELETALFRLTRTCLPMMFASTKSEGALCDYYMFFHQLRPLIKSMKVVYEGEFDDKPMTFQGPSGAMSSILPCIDAFLGIKMSSPVLRKMLRSFEAYIPKRHQEFLSQIRQRPSVRQYVRSLKSTEPYLVYSFNSIIDRVLDFRWSHFQFVKKYVIEQAPNGTSATGTGGTPAFRYLHQHIKDTEDARIVLGDTPQQVRPRHAKNQSIEVPPLKLLDVEESKKDTIWKVGLNGFLSSHPPPVWSCSTLGKGGGGGGGGGKESGSSSSSSSSWSSLSPSCLVLRELSRALPTMCVADGPYRKLVQSRRKDLEAFYDAIDDLSVMDKEFACSLLAFIYAGYTASTDHSLPSSSSLIESPSAASNLGALAAYPTRTSPGQADDVLFAKEGARAMKGNEGGGRGGRGGARTAGTALSSVPLHPSSSRDAAATTGNAKETQLLRLAEEGKRKRGKEGKKEGMATSATTIKTTAATTTELDGGEPPPPWLCRPLNKLAVDLDRPNHVCYSDMVLINWRECRRHERKTHSKKDFHPCRENINSIRIVNRFLAVPAEEWFWRLHVAMEGEAREIIHAIHNGIEAIRKDKMEEVTISLNQLSNGIRSLIACHPDPYPHSARAELVLWRRLKPFIAANASLKELSCFVYAGHSPILPTLFKYLGVKRGRHRLQRWRDESVKNMPTEHRKFIGMIESTQSARTYLKSMIAHRKRREGTPRAKSRMHDVAVLEVSFNKCIEQLLRFCSRRSQLVCRCVPQAAQWFREIQMKQEAEYLTRSHCALLVGHQLMAPLPKSINRGGKHWEEQTTTKPTKVKNLFEVADDKPPPRPPPPAPNAAPLKVTESSGDVDIVVGGTSSSPNSVGVSQPSPDE